MHILKSRINTSQWVVLLLSALACSVMLWAYLDRVSAFESSHRALSQSTTVELANQVSFILKERQRQVKLFAEDNLHLLRKLQNANKDEALRSTLERALKRALPDFFAFTIANAGGEPLLVDFDGMVGEICVQDIQLFAKNGQHTARIHPNNFRYHFDVMTEWRDSKGLPNLLMVSFEPTELGHLLKAVEQPGHQLMLITASETPMMEVTAEGGRDRTPRDDYRLTAEELGRLLTSHTVQLSGWKVADFAQPGFFSDYRQQVLSSLSVFLLAFAVVIGAALIMLRREERRRIAAEHAREELVSMITHEMRTPVTAISGTLALLANGLMGTPPEAMKSSFSLLERNAERLRRLIDDLLESRRIDSEQFTLQKIPSNLQQLVSDTILHLRDYAGQLDVSVEQPVVDKELWIDADPVRIQQILSNLISNAAKYSAHGGVVQVQVTRLPDDKVRVSVTDHGQGIPLAFQSSVFKKFARGPAPKHRQVASTGLGLSIVKALVEAHGGHIGFVSTEGQGSTFYFDLPLHQFSAN